MDAIIHAIGDGVKGYKAATVNAYLAPLRALVRAQGRTLKVKGVKQVQAPIETLDARSGPAHQRRGRPALER